VLVFHDVLGFNRTAPKFVRCYADLATAATTALAAYAADVRSGAFPGEAEVYH
jgi:3-methyl-2-oxobutanoate hydroxymethyltransferase